MFPFILHLLQVLELIACKYRRKCIRRQCSCIELGMKCTEACVSLDSKNFWNEEADKNFWNEEADLENTELDENDFDLEE